MVLSSATPDGPHTLHLARPHLRIHVAKPFSNCIGEWVFSRIARPDSSQLMAREIHSHRLPEHPVALLAAQGTGAGRHRRAVPCLEGERDEALQALSTSQSESGLQGLLAARQEEVKVRRVWTQVACGSPAQAPEHHHGRTSAKGELALDMAQCRRGSATGRVIRGRKRQEVIQCFKGAVAPALPRVHPSALSRPYCAANRRVRNRRSCSTAPVPGSPGAPAAAPAPGPGRADPPVLPSPAAEESADVPPPHRPTPSHHALVAVCGVGSAPRLLRLLLPALRS